MEPNQTPTPQTDQFDPNLADNSVSPQMGPAPGVPGGDGGLPADSGSLNADSLPTDSGPVDLNGLPPADGAEASGPDQENGEFASGKGYIPSFIARSEQLEEEDARMPLSQVLRIYVLPIITVGVFIGVVVFLIIPAISNMFSNFDQISALGDEVDRLDEDITELQTLGATMGSVNNDLQLMNTLVPTSATEIVAFQQKIIELARNLGLQVIEASTSEEVLTNEEDGPEALGIIEIPTAFSVRGELAIVKEFIAELETIDDFLIIGEMKLTAEVEEEDEVFEEDIDGNALNAGVEASIWHLELVLIKYQFQTPDENNQLTEVYLRVPPLNEPDAEVMEIVRRQLSDTNLDGVTTDSFFSN